MLSEDSLQLSCRKLGHPSFPRERGRLQKDGVTHTSVHPMHQHTTQNKGVSLPVPAWGACLGGASLLGTQAEYCHPKGTQPCPFCKPSFSCVSSVLSSHQDTEAQRGEEACSRTCEEKSRSPQQAGQDSHLLLSSFTTRPSLHQPGWRIRGRGKVLPMGRS